MKKRAFFVFFLALCSSASFAGNDFEVLDRELMSAARKVTRVVIFGNISKVATDAFGRQANLEIKMGGGSLLVEDEEKLKVVQRSIVGYFNFDEGKNVLNQAVVEALRGNLSQDLSFRDFMVTRTAGEDDVKKTIGENLIDVLKSQKDSSGAPKFTLDKLVRFTS